ncbi:MAG: hypothetical protein M1574_06100 [Gammaproteobacteria bacterium]|nr:hypothetical protein [Gammaproteobacteria bacterium]
MSRRRLQRATSARRQAIADEAARLMLDHGIADYGLAKRKAAVAFGEPPHGIHLPTNEEIESARHLRQSLYTPDAPVRVEQLRRLALRVMNFLHPLRSALTGDALRGIVTAQSRLELHVFCQTPEEVALHLLDKGLPYELQNRRYRFPRYETSLTTFVFAYDGCPVVLTPFTEEERQSPLSPLDGQPYPRADRRALLLLLERGA